MNVWSDIVLKYLDSVRLLPSADASVCGLGNTVKIRAVFKSAPTFSLCVLSQGYSSLRLVCTQPSPPPGTCGSLSRLTRAFLFSDIPAKFVSVLLICYLPQLVLYLRLAAMLALIYIIFKKYTYIGCILIFPNKDAQ